MYALNDFFLNKISAIKTLRKRTIYRCHRLQHVDGKNELTLDTDAYREGFKSIRNSEQKLPSFISNVLLSLLACQLNLTPLFLDKLLAQGMWKGEKEPRRGAAASSAGDIFCLGDQIL